MPNETATQLLRLLNRILLSINIPSDERKILISIRDELFLLSNSDLSPKAYIENRYRDLVELMLDLEPVFINLELEFAIRTEEIRNLINALNNVNPTNTGE